MRSNKSNRNCAKGSLEGIFIIHPDANFSGRVENSVACYSIFHDSPMLANDEELLNWDIRHIWGRSIPIGRMGKLRKFRSSHLTTPASGKWVRGISKRVLSGKSFQLIHAGSSYRKSNRPSWSLGPLPGKGFNRSLTLKKLKGSGCLVSK